MPPEEHLLKAVLLGDRGAHRSLVEVLDKFLDWCQENRKPKAYEWYRWRLQLFTEHAGTTLTPEALRHYHLDEFLKHHPSWSRGMKRTAAPGGPASHPLGQEEGVCRTQPRGRLREAGPEHPPIPSSG